MERSKQIQIGLLGVLAILLVTNLVGGGFKNLYKSEGSKIRESAAMVNSETSGNIPGTNVNVTPDASGPTTSITFDNQKFNYGVIDEGEVVKHPFKFKNVGNVPLTISNCKGSCGCTVPTWPHEPIPAGGEGEIMVEFNSKGKPGANSKRVTVTANTNPTETMLEISGEVKGKDLPAAKGSQ